MYKVGTSDGRVEYRMAESGMKGRMLAGELTTSLTLQYKTVLDRDVSECTLKYVCRCVA